MSTPGEPEDQQSYVLKRDYLGSSRYGSSVLRHILKLIFLAALTFNTIFGKMRYNSIFIQTFLTLRLMLG